jgi:hypothetical protein
VVVGDAVTVAVLEIEEEGPTAPQAEPIGVERGDQVEISAVLGGTVAVEPAPKVGEDLSRVCEVEDLADGTGEPHFALCERSGRSDQETGR